MFPLTLYIKLQICSLPEHRHTDTLKKSEFKTSKSSIMQKYE